MKNSEGKLKIVFLDFILDLSQPGRNGLSDIVWDMASELVNQGHDVHVVGPYPQNLAPDQRVIVHTVKVPPTGYRWFVGHLWICKRLAAIAFKLKPDIVHAPEYVSIAVYNTLYRNANSRQVMTVPGNIFHRMKSKNGNPYAFFYTQCLKWAARKSARSGNIIQAISHEMKKAWEETGSPSKLTLEIPLGTNTNRFFEVKDSRQKLGIADDIILLLYVGRFSREKGVLELVDTVGRCHDALKAGNVKVLLCGKGPQESLLVKKIEELKVGDIVTKLDWVPQEELPSLYSAADALLLPSFTEGFARVLPEAMICGTPIIGSRITGTEDVVIPGQTGFLFESGDFDQLGRILEQVAVNPNLLRLLRTSTKAYAEANLTWPMIVSKIINQIYLPEVFNKEIANFDSKK